jgi:hypothetical protein
MSLVKPRPDAGGCRLAVAAAAGATVELEQAMNLGMSMGAYGCREMFHSYISCSLQQLRDRHGGSPLAAHAPSPVSQERAVAVAEAAPTAPAPGVAGAAAPASSASGLAMQTEQSADLGECAEELLELSRPKARGRSRDGAPGEPSTDSEPRRSAWGCAPADGGGPVMDSSAVMEQLRKAECTGEINSNSSRRPEALYELLIKCQAEGMLAFETDYSASKTCILGWSKLLVKAPQELNARIREMVQIDLRGIWRRANGKHATQLINLTWGVYELFRKIGVKPRIRGPEARDPGKHDMVYYKEWQFVNGESFHTARERLAKGFSYGPEKGGLPRKIRRVGEKPVKGENAKGGHGVSSRSDDDDDVLPAPMAFCARRPVLLVMHLAIHLLHLSGS